MVVVVVVVVTVVVGVSREQGRRGGVRMMVGKG